MLMIKNTFRNNQNKLWNESRRQSKQVAAVIKVYYFLCDHSPLELLRTTQVRCLKKFQKNFFSENLRKWGRRPQEKSPADILPKKIIWASILTPEVGKWSKKAIFRRFLGVL